jgi:hypothetical protein
VRAETMTLPQWEALWSGVLARYVDDRGRTDFHGLAANPGGLDRVVAFIAETAPSNRPDWFPDRNSKIAFYINAYNALAMYGVVQKGIPSSLDGLRKFTFFYLQNFTIGGKFMSLYALENDIIRPMGEERIHFALNCMVVGCPRLPRTAFSAAVLGSQLRTVAQTFVGETRNVEVDSSLHLVSLSSIFSFYTQDFLAHAPSLIGYVNGYRQSAIPTNYDVKFIDYDWTVNDQHRANRE